MVVMQPRGYNVLTVFTRDDDDDDYAHGSEKRRGIAQSYATLFFVLGLASREGCAEKWNGCALPCRRLFL